MELVESIWFRIAVNVFMGDHARQRSVLVENTSRRPRFTLAKPHDHFIHFPADNRLQLQSTTSKHQLVCINTSAEPQKAPIENPQVNFKKHQTPNQFNELSFSNQPFQFSHPPKFWRSNMERVPWKRKALDSWIETAEMNQKWLVFGGGERLLAMMSSLNLV